MGNYLVLFLGHANAGRTLMAEALGSRRGAPGFRASSAGLEPGTEIDPVGIQLPQATGRNRLSFHR